MTHASSTVFVIDDDLSVPLAELARMSAGLGLAAPAEA